MKEQPKNIVVNVRKLKRLVRSLVRAEVEFESFPFLNVAIRLGEVKRQFHTYLKEGES